MNYEVVRLFFKGGVDVTFYEIFSIIIHNSAINYQIAKVSKLNLLSFFMWVVANQSNLEVQNWIDFIKKNECLNDIFVNFHGTGTTKVWPNF